MKKLLEGFNHWLVRDEISIKQKLLNVSLALIILIMIPCILFTSIAYKNLFSVSLPVMVIVVVVIGLLCSNKAPKTYKMWTLFVTSFICFFLLPACYFWDGGRETSDDAWFATGLILIFFLLNGVAMWIMIFWIIW